MRWWLLLLIVGCVAGDAPADGDDWDENGDEGGDGVSALANDGVDIQRGIVFDGVHALDLYRPANAGARARPLVMWIHGGAFAKNSRRDHHLETLAKESAKLGYVSVSIDYTLANTTLDPAHPYPYPWPAVAAARGDAMAALRFVRAHASEYGIDPQRVAVGGASAGAMTALEVAYGSTPADRDPGIVAVVDLWGAMQTQTLLQRGDAPLLIFHGTDDHLWMPFEHAIDLRNSAHAMDVPCKFVPLQGRGHGPWDGLDAYLADIRPFLRNHLGT